VLICALQPLTLFADHEHEISYTSVQGDLTIVSDSPEIACSIHASEVQKLFDEQAVPHPSGNCDDRSNVTGNSVGVFSTGIVNGVEISRYDCRVTSQATVRFEACSTNGRTGSQVFRLTTEVQILEHPEEDAAVDELTPEERCTGGFSILNGVVLCADGAPPPDPVPEESPDDPGTTPEDETPGDSSSPDGSTESPAGDPGDTTEEPNTTQASGSCESGIFDLIDGQQVCRTTGGSDIDLSETNGLLSSILDEINGFSPAPIPEDVPGLDGPDFDSMAEEIGVARDQLMAELNSIGSEIRAAIVLDIATQTYSCSRTFNVLGQTLEFCFPQPSLDLIALLGQVILALANVYAFFIIVRAMTDD